MNFAIKLCATFGLFVPGIVSQDSPHLVMLLTDLGQRAIYRIHIHHMNLTRLPIPDVSAPVAISYDKFDNHIYWTDSNIKKVRRADLDGRNDRVIANLSSASSSEGLTLDSNTRQVFYTDQGNDAIVRIEMDTLQSTVIVNTGLNHPKGIVADTTHRKLFWIDLGNTSKIETCNYNGNERSEVVSAGLIQPSGITIDEQAERLFWTDVGGSVESVLVSGRDRRRIMKKNTFRWNGIATFNGFLYLTILQDRNIYFTLTEDNNRISVPYISSTSLRDPAGIHVFSPNTNTPNSCPYGQYGPTCARCGNCKYEIPCEKTTGVCLRGCSSGYKRDMCTEVCDPGTFGEECESVCSENCKPGNVCDHVDGHCPGGCQSGWIGENCTTRIESTGDNPGIETTGDGPPIGLIVGIVVGVAGVIIAVAVVATVLITRWYRKRRHETYARYDDSNKDHNNYETLGNMSSTAVFTVQQGQHGSVGEAFR